MQFILKLAGARRRSFGGILLNLNITIKLLFCSYIVLDSISFILVLNLYSIAKMRLNSAGGNSKFLQNLTKTYPQKCSIFAFN